MSLYEDHLLLPLPVSVAMVAATYCCYAGDLCVQVMLVHGVKKDSLDSARQCMKVLTCRWPPSKYESQAADMDMEQRDVQESHSSSTALEQEQGASKAAPALHTCDGLAQWAADRAGRIAERSRARLDLLMDQGMNLLCRTMPLPCMEVSRRSALRMRIQWHGFTWPPVKPEVPQTCEVYL